MSMSDRSRDKVTRFLLSSFKLRLNDDDGMIAWAGSMTKDYRNGTYRLNKQSGKLGARISVELGYEERKLE